MKRALLLAVLLFGFLGPRPASALVNYDKGSRSILGVQLLQDSEDPTAYYYLPQFPRLAMKEDSTFEFLCLKYVDQAGGTNGGLFHALIEFTLPEPVVKRVEAALKEKVAGARLMGPVPLMQSVKDGEDGMGSFEVVSAVLSNKGEGGFTRSLVTSGRAPLMPGSKAVVAALLKQEGATLLWNSLTSPTSDVSVGIHGYYEAAVEGYNAKITADVSTVYQHFSSTTNVQQDYTKTQLRNAVDNLQRDGTLKIEVLDRTAGLGIKAEDMAGVLQLVTDKLVQLMFDSKEGWAKDPEREAAVEANQIQGRQERGWFSSVFGGAQDTKYFTDNQYVLKNRKDIRQNKFVLSLSKKSTIKVPLDTAGNLGGLYQAMGTDPRYFRVVNLSDPDFEFRPVYFQVDGDYIDSFQDALNFVTVNFRKSYPDRPAFTKAVMFNRADVEAGKTTQNVAFPRLGMTSQDWTQYEYQVRWSLRAGPTLSVPAGQDRWMKGSDAALSLTPPFDRRVVEVEADRSLFGERGYATAVVEFATILAGKPRLMKKLTLRAADTTPTSKIALILDKDSQVAYKVTWHAKNGSREGKLAILDSDYLFLTPPEAQGATNTGTAGAPGVGP
ncbi:MAG TPA: hypothetical protein VFD83_05840 [Candidatus Polarisedimenticolia bacterium]|nr:hypothetical protein [Candidatus Polarisedimenticolia bacterium]